MKGRGFAALVVIGACAGAGFFLDWQWTVPSGGTDSDRGWAVAAFDEYYAVTLGDFEGAATFGTHVDAPGLTSLGDTDAFVIRHGYAGVVDWARHVGSPGAVAPRGVARLPDGSFVVTCAFEQTVTASVGRPDATDLTSAGEADILLARYDSDGVLIWAQRAGGTGQDEPRGVDGAADGSFLVTGYFTSDSITFGPGEARQTVLERAGDQTEMFVARYNADGTLAWAKRAGGTATCTGNDIACWDDGSSVAAVRVEGTITFGEGEANETRITSAGGTDIALARYDPEGALVWATRAGGSSADTPWGIDVFGNGVCAVSGNIAGTSTFGAGEANETVLTAVGDWDIVLARFNADGTLQWARSAGGPAQEVSRGLAGLADGSIAITGRFRDVCTFGRGEPAETILTSQGESDVFVARYHASGFLLWARGFGGVGADQGEDLSGAADGGFLVTGRFEDTVTFPEGLREGVTYASAGGSDVFTTRFLRDGE